MNELLYKMQLVGYVNREYWTLVKKPTTGTANPTARFKRLRTLAWCLVGLGLGLPLLWLPHTVAFANRLMTPWEAANKRRYLRRAKRVLRRRPDLIVIGITGSYGKTSVKNILAAMLATQYRVVSSPASFNTPQGFARTVNEHLTPATQVLIMEMGARHVGDIAEMCDLCHPHHGIITSIGECHLATFGDVATVAATKAELFAALPANGIAVTDGDNPWCRALVHPRLTLVHRAAEHFTTPLLGEHNQTNIALAAVVAREVGVSDEAIKAVVAELTPSDHRLQKIVAPNGIVILDDSYNANPTSAASALKVLGTYTTRKVVQTPGFVEQGTNTATAHAELCAQIKATADAVIVVGEVNRRYFVDGLAGWDKPVFYVPTRDAAKNLYPTLLKAGDVLLLLNDLPENY